MYDDDQDALAAEYVLGTLAGEERDQAEALLAIDPGFADAVRQWERRLGELNVMVEAVEPPPEIWDKIRAEIGGVMPSEEPQLVPLEEAAPATAMNTEAEAEPAAAGDLATESELQIEPDPNSDAEMTAVVAALASALLPPDAESENKPDVMAPAKKIERSADVVYLATRVRRWRRTTLVAGAIAAVLALYIGLSQFAPGLLPIGRNSSSQVTASSQVPAKPQGSRLVAALEQEPISPGFLVTVDSESRTLTVRRVSATPEAGHSYELWLISNRFPTPRSLGVVGNDEFTQRPLPANADLNTMRAASYAVSLEPAGGSPSGVPTGPILFTGKLVESLPTSPSPG